MFKINKRKGANILLIKERRNFIISQLKENGKVTVHELAEELAVSEMTIRRDLKKLEAKGAAVRSHGGAVYPDVLNKEISYQSKQTKNIEEKNKIGHQALKYIAEGKSIFIDAGTTCFALARKINLFKDLTVITNDIKIAHELYLNPNINLFCTGGLVQPAVGAMLGEHAEKFIESLNIDLAFLGTSSIDNELYLSTPTREKAALKRKIIKSANKAILLSDHSKFNQKSLHKICQINEFDLFITDQEISKAELAKINNIETEVVLV